jgi:hypothetical protein
MRVEHLWRSSDCCELSGVTPNIHAAQQRLLRHQRGSALEVKLSRRPHVRQLVLQ